MADRLQAELLIKVDKKQAENEIESFTDRIKSDEAIELATKITGFKEEKEKLKREIRDIDKEIKITTDPSKIEDLTKRNKELKTQMEIVSRQISVANSELTNFGKTGDKNLSVLGKKFNEIGKSVDGLAGKIGGGIKTSLLAIGTGLASLGIGVKSILDFTNGIKTLGAQTGTTGEELKELETSVLNIQKAGFTDQAQVIQGISALRKGAELTGKELEEATKNALTLSRVFGKDLNKVIDASIKLQKNFNIENKEAGNLIAGVLQEIPDLSDDALDSIIEYSSGYAAAGGKAEDFFNTIIEGSKRGIRNTDELVDAQREFILRFQNGEKSTREGFAKLGISYDDYKKKVQDGEMTVAEVQKEVAKTILSQSDAFLKAEASANIFGTKAEDIGEPLIEIFASVENKIGDTTGKVDELQKTMQSGLGGAIDQLIGTIPSMVSAFLSGFDSIGSGVAGGSQELKSFQDFLIQIAGVIGVVGGGFVKVVGMVINGAKLMGVDFGLLFNATIPSYINSFQIFFLSAFTEIVAIASGVGASIGQILKNVSDIGIITFENMLNDIKTVTNDVIDTLNQIPGIDIEKFADIGEIREVPGIFDNVGKAYDEAGQKRRDFFAGTMEGLQETKKEMDLYNNEQLKLSKQLKDDIIYGEEQNTMLRNLRDTYGELQQATQKANEELQNKGFISPETLGEVATLQEKMEGLSEISIEPKFDSLRDEITAVTTDFDGLKAGIGETSNQLLDVGKLQVFDNQIAGLESMIVEFENVKAKGGELTQDQIKGFTEVRKSVENANAIVNNFGLGEKIGEDLNRVNGQFKTLETTFSGLPKKAEVVANQTGNSIKTIGGATNEAVQKVNTSLGNINGQVAINKVIQTKEGIKKNLVIDATQYGVNLMNSFGSGITRAIGGLKASAVSAMNAVKRIIKVESPAEEGPLAVDQSIWGENLANTWAKGFERGGKNIQEKVKKEMEEAKKKLMIEQGDLELDNLAKEYTEQAKGNASQILEIEKLLNIEKRKLRMTDLELIYFNAEQEVEREKKAKDEKERLLKEQIKMQEEQERILKDLKDKRIEQEKKIMSIVEESLKKQDDKINDSKRNIEDYNKSIEKIGKEFEEMGKKAGDELKKIGKELSNLEKDTSLDLAKRSLKIDYELTGNQKDLENANKELEKVEKQEDGEEKEEKIFHLKEKILSLEKIQSELEKERLLIKENVSEQEIEELRRIEAMSETEKILLEYEKEKLELLQKKAVQQGIIDGNIRKDGKDIFVGDEKITDEGALEKANEFLLKQDELNTELGNLEIAKNRELEIIDEITNKKIMAEALVSEKFGIEIEKRKGMLEQLLEATSLLGLAKEQERTQQAEVSKLTIDMNLKADENTTASKEIIDKLATEVEGRIGKKISNLQFNMR